MEANTKFGLYPHEIEYLKQVMAEFDEVEKVWIFGSRSMGNYKFNSDFDLAINGKAVNHSTVNALKERLESEFFPLSFDIVDYQTISSEPLLTHIAEEGQLLYADKASEIKG